MNDYIIKNAIIITMDKTQPIIHNGYVHIKNGLIEEIGSGEIEATAEVIDAKGNLVMPGLINAHTHLPMTLFRGFADDLPLQEWLGEIWPVEDKLSDDDIYWCAQLAIMESITYGVTTVADMYFSENAIAKAVSESGIRAVLGRALLNMDGKLEQRIQDARNLYNNWHGYDNGRITTMVAPHAEYTNTSDSIIESINLSHDLGIGLHVHVSETQREVRECFGRHGCSPVEYFNSLELFGTNVLAAHCVALSDNDIDILSDKKVNVAHNPGSNLKLASGVAPIPKMIDKGINVALGTDGAGSNNSLDIWRDMYLASIVHKGFTNNPTAITAEQALEMATINGAKALSLNTGKIAVGLIADIIMVDMDSPWFKPINNITKLLVYSGTRANVIMTMVNGNIIYRNGEYMTINREEVIYNVEKIKKRVFK